MKKILKSALIISALSLLVACSEEESDTTSEKSQKNQPSETVSNSKEKNSQEQQPVEEESSEKSYEERLHDFLNQYSSAYLNYNWEKLYDMSYFANKDITSKEEYAKEFEWIDEAAKSELEFELKLVEVIEPSTHIKDGLKFSKILVDVTQKASLDDGMSEDYQGLAHAYVAETDNKYGFVLEDDIEYLDVNDQEKANDSPEEKNEENPPSEQTDSFTYKTYTNSRFGFTVEYPATFTEDTPPSNNDGRKFYNEEATIIASGSHINIIEENETIETYYNRKIESVSSPIAYQRLGDDWYVISYTEGDQIFYLKSIIGDDIISNLSISYPANKKDYYDPMVTRIADNFKGGKTELTW